MNPGVRQRRIDPTRLLAGEVTSWPGRWFGPKSPGPCPPLLRSPAPIRPGEVAMKRRLRRTLAAAGGVLALSLAPAAQAAPEVLDPNLAVRTAVSGLNQPTSIAFLAANDVLVLEKATGKVQRVVDGAVQATVLDLAVNSGSERGLLGIALHPNFPTVPDVYLYWTQSSTGADTDVLSETPLLGNRVDRFRWDGSTLTFDQNLILIRALQQDAGQPERGNHDGGVLRFGPDGKLYVIVGDLGRRGQMQNLENGPFGPGIPDDQFGGPEPDDAHLSGVILRLNDNGSTPTDKPFFAVGAAMGGEGGANVQKVFAYGIRNTFGMAFDPISGALWEEENGEDAFDEINLVERGMNSGWIQIAGPSSRVSQYREIETTSTHEEAFPNLQQFRWGPERIATTPAEAKSRLFLLPGSRYSEPEFSWKWVVTLAAIGFIDGRGLGPQYDGDLLAGLAEDE